MGHVPVSFESRFDEKVEDWFIARAAKEFDFGSESKSIMKCKQEYDRWNILETDP